MNFIKCATSIAANSVADEGLQSSATPVAATCVAGGLGLHQVLAISVAATSVAGGMELHLVAATSVVDGMELHSACNLGCCNFGRRWDGTSQFLQFCLLQLRSPEGGSTVNRI